MCVCVWLADVGGRHYYGGGRPYSYYYGNRVIFYGAVFYSIGYGGHGCYSCAGTRRNCRDCGNCGSRTECGARSSTTAASDLDRYQLDLTFDAPVDAAQWPLTLRVYNVTIFVPRSASMASNRGTALYLNFFTSAGDSLESITSTSTPLAWLVVIVASIFICCNHQTLCPEERARPRVAHRTNNQQVSAYPAVMSQHHSETRHDEYQMHAYPYPEHAGQPVAHGYPAHGPPVAYPVASGYAVQQMPVATGRPATQADMPVTRGVAVAANAPLPVAMPSVPPSPPSGAANKED